MSYKFNFKNQYENPSVKVPRAILTSFISGLTGFTIMFILFIVAALISVIFTNIWPINFILVVVGVVVVMDIYKRNIINHTVGSIFVYKITSIFTILFMCLYLPSLIAFNLKAFGKTLLTSGEELPSIFSLFNNSTLFNGIVATRKLDLDGSIIYISPLITYIFIALILGYIAWKIKSFNYVGYVYVVTEDNLSEKRFEFTLFKEADNVTKFDMEYINKLKLDYSDVMYINKTYLDFYSFGQYEEKYFYFEKYNTYEKNGKLKQAKKIISPVFEFNVEEFKCLNDSEQLVLDEELENEMKDKALNALSNKDLVEVPVNKKPIVEDVSFASNNSNKTNTFIVERGYMSDNLQATSSIFSNETSNKEGINNEELEVKSNELQATSTIFKSLSEQKETKTTASSNALEDMLNSLQEAEKTDVGDDVKGDKLEVTEDVKDEKLEVTADVKDEKLEVTADVKNEELEVTEDVKDEKLEFIEDVKNEELEVTEDVKNEELEVTADVKNEELEVTAEVKDEELEVTADAKDEDLEVTADVKDEKLEVTEDVKDQELEVTANVKDEELEVTADINDNKLDVTEDVNDEELEVIEDVNDNKLDVTEDKSNLKNMFKDHLNKN